MELAEGIEPPTI